MGSIDRRRYRPKSTAAAINWRAKIQQRYGLAKDLVRKDVDHWLDAQPVSDDCADSIAGERSAFVILAGPNR